MLNVNRDDYGVALVIEMSFWQRFRVLFFGQIYVILTWKKPVTEWPGVGVVNGSSQTLYHWQPK